MSKKRVAAIIIDFILILVTLAFIFGNSLKDVESSSNQSEPITEIVEKIPYVESALENKEITHSQIKSIVRSLAHVAEFALLGALVMILMLLLDMRISCAIITTLISSLVIGITDECLQTLTDRSCELVDIVKDFAGATIGSTFVLMIYLIITKIKKAKQE
ncbi:MAG: VanZ family protein [Clostridia bacterium]|nr:VanZ family protein [Clostridia bacterium]